MYERVITAAMRYSAVVNYAGVKDRYSEPERGE
jgi:hypothetical protein